MTVPGNASKKGKKGAEKKDVPLPIHGHHHGKDQLGHSHGNQMDLHHSH
jgi:hypothetical protein